MAAFNYTGWPRKEGEFAASNDEFFSDDEDDGQKARTHVEITARNKKREEAAEFEKMAPRNKEVLRPPLKKWCTMTNKPNDRIEVEVAYTVWKGGKVVEHADREVVKIGQAGKNDDYDLDEVQRGWKTEMYRQVTDGGIKNRFDSGRRVWKSSLHL